MTLRIPAHTRDELETAVWAAETARPWMRRASCSVGKTATGEWFADLEMEE